MKILLITRNFNKHGGISRYAVELSKKLIKEHEIHLITTNYDYNIPKIHVHYKPMVKNPIFLQLLSNVYSNTTLSKKVKNTYDIDIINSYGAESFYFDIVRMPSCHRAWVNQSQFLDHMFKIKGRFHPYNITVLAIEKKVLERKSQKIIAISERIKQEILRFYQVPEEKITVIPNGVNINQFKPNLTARKKIRKKYHFNNNEIILLFSGHYFKRKGLEYIIKAMPMVDKGIKVLIIGKDNQEYYRQLALKYGVVDRICFTGFIHGNIINEYYAASDIFIFPTQYEPFGLVITEAMASGIPPITSNLAGAAELITNGKDGLLLENPRNVHDIADKINLLTEDEQLRRKMGENARKTAKNYSWNRVAQKTLIEYQKLLEERNIL